MAPCSSSQTGWDPNSIETDGNFAAAMTFKHTWWRGEPKSAHQLKALLDAGTYFVLALMKGCTKTGVPSKDEYSAHVRFGWLPKNGC